MEVGAVVAACGACDPKEVTPGVSDEEDGLGRGAQLELHEVLAGP